MRGSLHCLSVLTTSAAHSLLTHAARLGVLGACKALCAHGAQHAPACSRHAPAHPRCAVSSSALTTSATLNRLSRTWVQPSVSDPSYIALCQSYCCQCQSILTLRASLSLTLLIPFQASKMSHPRTWRQAIALLAQCMITCCSTRPHSCSAGAP